MSDDPIDDPFDGMPEELLDDDEKADKLNLVRSVPSVPFRLYRSYEGPGSVKLVSCRKCGAGTLDVGQGNYLTVVRCRTCGVETMIHEG